MTDHRAETEERVGGYALIWPDGLVDYFDSRWDAEQAKRRRERDGRIYRIAELTELRPGEQIGGAVEDSGLLDLLEARGVESIYFRDQSQLNPGSMSLRAAVACLHPVGGEATETRDRRSDEREERTHSASVTQAGGGETHPANPSAESPVVTVPPNAIPAPAEAGERLKQFERLCGDAWNAYAEWYHGGTEDEYADANDAVLRGLHDMFMGRTSPNDSRSPSPPGEA